MNLPIELRIGFEPMTSDLQDRHSGQPELTEQHAMHVRSEEAEFRRACCGRSRDARLRSSGEIRTPNLYHLKVAPLPVGLRNHILLHLRDPGETRTLNPLRELGPKPSAYAISATRPDGDCSVGRATIADETCERVRSLDLRRHALRGWW